jgi:hypothetical protein
MSAEQEKDVTPPETPEAKKPAAKKAAKKPAKAAAKAAKGAEAKAEDAKATDAKKPAAKKGARKPAAKAEPAASETRCEPPAPARRAAAPPLRAHLCAQGAHGLRTPARQVRAGGARYPRLHLS